MRNDVALRQILVSIEEDSERGDEGSEDDSDNEPDHDTNDALAEVLRAMLMFQADEVDFDECAKTNSTKLSSDRRDATSTKGPVMSNRKENFAVRPYSDSRT